MSGESKQHSSDLPTLILAVAIVGLPSPAFAADIYSGRSVYALHCEGCHGADGRSLDPGTPDFSRGDALFAPDAALVRLIRDGRMAMPAYRGLLSDAEIRDVVAYLRTLQR